MRCFPVSLALARHRWQALCIATTFAMLPLYACAQNSGQNVSEESGLLTTLLPDHIALPIGDGGKMMQAVVYVPHNYDPKTSYPLLVVLDADPLLGLIKTLNFLWVEEGKAGPVILVGLPFGASAGTIWVKREVGYNDPFGGRKNCSSRITSDSPRGNEGCDGR